MQGGVEWAHRVSTPMPSCSRPATSPATGANERRTADTGSGSAHGVPGLKKSDHTELPCTEDLSAA